MWRPVRTALANISSVQMPSPVLSSGVRFAAKLTPHGPENAVPLAAIVISHAADGAAVPPVIGNDSGCPDSIRAMSGSGPFGPILSGVWQSLQPPIVTRYLPRSTWARAALASLSPAGFMHATAPSNNAAPINALEKCFDMSFLPVDVQRFTGERDVGARKPQPWLVAGG